MASFDGNGLVIDRLADIKTQIQDNLRSVFGDGVNLSETSPFGVLVGIMSERYFLLYELLEAVYQASFVNTAYGIYLDELVALNGITRDAATASTVDLTFTRSNGTNDGDVAIPVGTQVTDPNSPSVIWVTDTEGTILDGVDTGVVGATANETGPLGALAGVLTNMISVPNNVASVTNVFDATLGRNEETDSELKLRRETQLGRSGTATEPGIRGALVDMDEVITATLILNDSDITDGDGRPPHSFEAFVSLESGFQLGQLSTLTLDTPPLVTLNSIQIQINGFDVAGSPVVFTTDSGTTMQLIADALEAEAEIAIATLNGTGDIISLEGATETAFTASAVVTLGASQSTITYGAGTPADGTITLVGQKIWDSKAAGIQTFGDFTATVVDSVGDDHLINFSSIEDIPVYVRYTLTTDGDYDSVTAEPAITQALVDYAITNLLPGVDVLNYKVLCAASDVNAVGILGIVVDFSLVGIGGPWDPANIPIGASQFAAIDSSNIIFA
jgi:hypothetical protein